MASRVTVKQMRLELKRRGLPIHRTMDIFVQPCRVNGVSCESPAGAAAVITPLRSTPTPTTPATPTTFAPTTPATSALTAPAILTRPKIDRTQSSSPCDGDAIARSPSLPPIGCALPTAAEATDGARAPFSKHERARLTHVLSEGEVAAGVIFSRRPMSRHQQDSKAHRSDVWVVVIAELFNISQSFAVPRECADGGIDPNNHPFTRTGLFLRAKWTEVGIYFAQILLAWEK